MKHESITKPRELIVPNTLENRPAMFYSTLPNIMLKVLSEKEFRLLYDGFVFEDINDAIGTLIDAWEEEEIPFKKLGKAIAVVEGRTEKEDDPEAKAAMGVLLNMLNLAKEKKTLLALNL